VTAGAGTKIPEAEPAAAASSSNGGRPGGTSYRTRVLPPIKPSNAPVELTLDLRATPPDKALSRLFGALERVADDVTLVVLLRDTPEYAGVVSTAYQILEQHGYGSDSSRFPPGCQRLRVFRRRRPARNRSQQMDRRATEDVPFPMQDTDEG
jgi:hypothetical protein